MSRVDWEKTASSLHRPLGAEVLWHSPVVHAEWSNTYDSMLSHVSYQ